MRGTPAMVERMTERTAVCIRNLFSRAVPEAVGAARGLSGGRNYHNLAADTRVGLAGGLLPRARLRRRRRARTGGRQANDHVDDLEDAQGNERIEERGDGVGDDGAELEGVDGEHQERVDVRVNAGDIGVEGLDGL